MHEESAWCLAVADDALGAGAEARVGELFVRGAPAARVSAPAEFGEGLVEATHERRQDGAFVELGDVRLGWRRHCAS
jgi:hypothetical protein